MADYKYKPSIMIDDLLDGLKAVQKEAASADKIIGMIGNKGNLNKLLATFMSMDNMIEDLIQDSDQLKSTFGTQLKGGFFTNLNDELGKLSDLIKQTQKMSQDVLDINLKKSGASTQLKEMAIQINAVLDSLNVSNKIDFDVFNAKSLKEQRDEIIGYINSIGSEITLSVGKIDISQLGNIGGRIAKGFDDAGKQVKNSSKNFDKIVKKAVTEFYDAVLDDAIDKKGKILSGLKSALSFSDKDFKDINDVFGQLDDGTIEEDDAVKAILGLIDNINNVTDTAVKTLDEGKTRLVNKFKDYYHAIEEAIVDGVDVMGGKASIKMSKIKNSINEMLSGLDYKASFDLNSIFQGLEEDDIGIDDIENEINNLISTHGIKIKLPVKDVAVNTGDAIEDEADKASAALERIEVKTDSVTDSFKELVSYISKSGMLPGKFFDNLENGAQDLDDELKNILQSLNLIGSSGNINIDTIKSGFTNKGGFVSDQYTMIARPDWYLPKIESIKQMLQNAQAAGAKIGAIFDIIEDKTNGLIYEVQNTVAGKSVLGHHSGVTNQDVLNATDDQIKDLINTLQILQQNGLFIDWGGDNVLYDKDKGFSIIDLGNKGGKSHTVSNRNTLQENLDRFSSEIFKFDGGMTQQFKSLFLNKLYESAKNVDAQVYNPYELNASRQKTTNKNITSDTKKEEVAHKQNADAINDENKALQAQIELKKKAQAMTWEKFALDESLSGLKNTAGIGSLSELEKFWKSSNYDKVVNFKEIDPYDAQNIIDSKFKNTSLLSNWFGGSNHNAKNQIENKILADDELRNAAMNWFYHLAKKYMPDDFGDMSFDDFLKSEIDVYRSDDGPVLYDHNQKLSFSLSAEKAKSIAGDKVEGTKIKPIDTVGNVSTGAFEDELEFFLPNYALPKGKDSLYISGKHSSFEDYYSGLDDKIQQKIKDEIIYLEKKRIENLLGKDITNLIDYASPETKFNVETLSKFQQGIIPDKLDVYGGWDTEYGDQLAEAYNNASEIQKKLIAYYASLNAINIDTPDSWGQYSHKNIGKTGTIDALSNDPYGFQKFVNDTTGIAKFGIFEQNTQAINQETKAHQKATQAIKQEENAQDELNQSKKQTISFKEVDAHLGLDAINADSFGKMEAINDLQHDIQSVEKTSSLLKDNGYYSDQFTGGAYDIEDLYDKVDKIEQQFSINLGYVKDYLNQVYQNFNTQLDEAFKAAQAGTNPKEFTQEEIVYKLSDMKDKAPDGQEWSDKWDLYYGVKYKDSEDIDLQNLYDLVDKIEAEYAEDLSDVKQYLLDKYGAVASIPEIDVVVPDDDDDFANAYDQLESTILGVDPSAQQNKYEKLCQVLDALNYANSTDQAIIDDGFYFDPKNLKETKISTIFDLINEIEATYGENLDYVSDYLRQVYKNANLDTHNVQEDFDLDEIDVLDDDVIDASDKKQQLSLGDSSQGIQNETVALDGLLNKINDVVNAVEIKNQAFTDEGSIVDAVVDNEIESLKKLEAYLDVLKLSINNLFDGINPSVIPTADVVDADNIKNVSGGDYALESTLQKTNSILDSILGALNSGDNANTSSTIEAAVKELKEVASDINKANKQNKKDAVSKKNQSDEQKKMASKMATSIAGEQTQYNKKIAGNVGSFAGSDIFTTNLDKYNDSLQKLKDAHQKLATAENLSQQEVDQTKEAFDIAKGECEKYRQALVKLINESNKFNSTHSNVTDDVGNFDLNDASGQEAALRKYVDTTYEGKATIVSFDNANKELIFTFKDGEGKVQQMAASFDASMTKIGSSVKEANKSTSLLGSLFGDLGKKWKELWVYASARFGVDEIIQQVRNGIQYVREIDSALTELKKVTDETDASYKRFLQDMSKTAGVVGSTVAELTTMSAEWARLGYSMEEAGQLAESTAILLNVSEFSDATEASEALISTMQAFSYTADESQHVVDILNEVGNNFAVSSDGIATALQDSASALMEGGNNLEQAVALVAAANKVVQDPNSVGSALRTISLRLRGTSVEVLEEMGEETDGVVSSVSKMQEKIRALTGVDIIDMNGAYKDTYTILFEIGKVWEKMSDIDQAALLELMAGKNRANTLAAILGNMEDLEGAYDVALNSNGSALKENEAYLNSIQGKIDILTNSVQTMWYNALNSDAIKFLLDVANALVKVVDKAGLLKSVFAILVGYFSFDAEKGNGLGMLNKIFPTLGNNITSLVGKLGLGKKAAALFGSALSSLAGFGISLAIQALWELGDALIVTKKEIREAAKEAEDAIDSISSEFKSKSKTVSEISGRFAELAQGVDMVSGKNLSLTTYDYEEFLDLSNQLADIFPTLSRNYDENGNAIVQLSGDTNTMVGSLQNLLEVERQIANQKIAEELPDLYKGVKLNSDEYKADLKTLKAQKETYESQLKYLNSGNLMKDLNSDLESGIISIYDEKAEAQALDSIRDSYLDVLDELDLAYSELTPDYKYDEELGYDKIVGYSFQIDYGGMTEEEIAKTKEKVAAGIRDVAATYSNEIGNLNNKIQTTVNQNKANWGSILSSITSWVSTESSYQVLNDDMQNVVKQMINNIDFSELDDIDKWEDMQKYIQENIILKIQGATPEVQNAFSELFKISPKDIETGDYINVLKKKAKEIEEMSNGLFNADEVLKNTGFQDVINQYETYASDIVKVLDDNLNGSQIEKLKKNIYSLAPDEMAKAFAIVKEYGIKTWSELQAALKNKTFDVVVDYDVEAAGFDKLQTALSETASSTGLSAESIAALQEQYQDLEGYDASRLFEQTASGIRLNTQAARELEDEYERLNKEALDNKLDGLVDQYNDLTEEIQGTSDAFKRAELYSQRQNILDQINDTATLAARYEGLTSAYNKWQTAQSGATERDMYEGILSGKEEIDEEIKRGWIDAGTREYLSLISGKDLSAASFEEVLAVYKELNKEIKNSGYNVYDFFTKDKDGNSTVDGIYNFLDAVMAVQEEGKEWVKKNKDGSFSFDFSVNGGDKAIAEALGISEELIEIILRAAQDAGFEINLESAYTELANLKDEAVEANERLKEIGATDYDFNINSTSIDNLNEQIKEAQRMVDAFNVNKIKSELESLEKGGNVNLLMRPQIESSELEKAGWGEQEDGIATVYTSTYSNEAGNVAINFTPIVVDENGQYVETLSPQALQEYAEGVIAGTRADDLKLQIGAKFEGENAIQEAEESAIKIHDLHEKYYSEETKLAQTMLATLIYQKQTLDTAIILKMDVENPTTGLETVIQKLKEFKAAANELEVATAIGVDTTEAQKKVDDATAALKEAAKTADIDLNADLGIDLEKSTAEINAKISSITPEMLLKIDPDTTLVDEYEAAEHTTEGELIWHNNLDEVTKWIKDPNDSKKATGYVTWYSDTTKLTTPVAGGGIVDVNGTAHIRGTAFAGGNWGAPRTETALVGELGPEMVVRGNRWFTVGDNGAEFTDIKKGDIIFNHKQTEDLLSKGYVTGRGKAYASGTAYREPKTSGLKYDLGSYGARQEQVALNNYLKLMEKQGKTLSEAYTKGAEAQKELTKKIEEYGDKGGGPSEQDSAALRKETENAKGIQKAISDSSKAAEDAKDEVEDMIDFIEIKLEEIEQTIAKTTAELENYVDDTSTVSEKNNLYDNLVSAEKNRADTYLMAAEEYNRKATEALKEIPAEYRKMAMNGAIAIKDFVGEDQAEIAEAINNYREWSNKADDAEVGYLESIAEQAALRVEQLQDIASDYENIIGVIETSSGLIESHMDFVEESGKRLSATYYNKLIKNSEEQKKKLEEERKDLQRIFDRAVRSGDVEKGSDEWYEMLDTIYEVDEAIVQCNTDIEEFNNSINELKFENLEKLIDRFDDIDSQLSHLHDRFTDGKIVDDEGDWNSDGIAAIGVLTQQMEVAEMKSRQYAEAIDELKEDYKNGLYSEDEFNEKLAELTENQWDAIESYESAKDAIVDLNKTRIDAVKDGIQEEIDAYKELIDKKKEALDADKDLYDFEKNVKEQQKDIATIERKLAALSGDTSASAAAQRKVLEAELAEAKANLEDTYRDRSIENQKNALDDAYEKFEEAKNKEMEALDEYLEREDEVIGDSVDIVKEKENAKTVLEELKAVSEQYGIDISNAIVSPWEDGANAVMSYDNQFGEVSESFIAKLQAIIDKEKELQKEADNTATGIINGIEESEKDTTSAKRKSSSGGSSGYSTVVYYDEKGNKLTKSQAENILGAVGGKVYDKSGKSYDASNAKVPGSKIYSSSWTDEELAASEVGAKQGGGSGSSKTISKGTQVTVSGNATNFSSKSGNAKMASSVKGSTYDVMQTSGNQVLIGKGGTATGWVDKKDLEKYAKGTKSIKDDQFAWIDEIGEELVLHAGSDGKLAYLTKGSGVIPADLTSKLMDLALDPTQTLENSRPNINAPHITNNEINIDMTFGEVVHIDTVTNDTIPDLTKAVEKQMDKYMKNLNNQIRRYAK